MSNNKSEVYFKKYHGREFSVRLAKAKDYDPCDLEVMAQLMGDVGFVMEVKGDYLSITVDANKLPLVNRARSGRKKKETEYRYSDIMYMLEEMNDKEVAEKIGLPMATFYRHKRTLMNSEYYRAIPPMMRGDRAYLESVEGNNCF